jgi:hypothetical protein
MIVDLLIEKFKINLFSTSKSMSKTSCFLEEHSEIMNKFDSLTKPNFHHLKIMMKILETDVSTIYNGLQDFCTLCYHDIPQEYTGNEIMDVNNAMEILLRTTTEFVEGKILTDKLFSNALIAGTQKIKFKKPLIELCEIISDIPSVDKNAGINIMIEILNDKEKILPLFIELLCTVPLNKMDPLKNEMKQLLKARLKQDGSDSKNDSDLDLDLDINQGQDQEFRSLKLVAPTQQTGITRIFKFISSKHSFRKPN